MLVDEDDGNVLALDEFVKRRFYSGSFGLVVYHQEVLLGVCARGYVLASRQRAGPS